MNLKTSKIYIIGMLSIMITIKSEEVDDNYMVSLNNSDTSDTNFRRLGMIFTTTEISSSSSSRTTIPPIFGKQNNLSSDMYERMKNFSIPNPPLNNTVHQNVQANKNKQEKGKEETKIMSTITDHSFKSISKDNLNNNNSGPQFLIQHSLPPLDIFNVLHRFLKTNKLNTSLKDYRVNNKNGFRDYQKDFLNESKQKNSNGNQQKLLQIHKTPTTAASSNMNFSVETSSKSVIRNPNSSDRNETINKILSYLNGKNMKSLILNLNETSHQNFRGKKRKPNDLNTTKNKYIQKNIFNDSDIKNKFDTKISDPDSNITNDTKGVKIPTSSLYNNKTILEPVFTPYDTLLSNKLHSLKKKLSKLKGVNIKKLVEKLTNNSNISNDSNNLTVGGSETNKLNNNYKHNSMDNDKKYTKENNNKSTIQSSEKVSQNNTYSAKTTSSNLLISTEGSIQSLSPVLKKNRLSYSNKVEVLQNRLRHLKGVDIDKLIEKVKELGTHVKDKGKSLSEGTEIKLDGYNNISKRIEVKESEESLLQKRKKEPEITKLVATTIFNDSNSLSKTTVIPTFSLPSLREIEILQRLLINLEVIKAKGMKNKLNNNTDKDQHLKSAVTVSQISTKRRKNLKSTSSSQTLSIKEPMYTKEVTLELKKRDSDTSTLKSSSFTSTKFITPAKQTILFIRKLTTIRPTFNKLKRQLESNTTNSTTSSTSTTTSTVQSITTTPTTTTEVTTTTETTSTTEVTTASDCVCFKVCYTKRNCTCCPNYYYVPYYYPVVPAPVAYYFG